MTNEGVETKKQQSESKIISVKEMRKLLGAEAYMFSDIDVEAFIQLCIVGSEIIIQSGLLDGESS